MTETNEVQEESRGNDAARPEAQVPGTQAIKEIELTGESKPVEVKSTYKFNQKSAQQALKIDDTVNTAEWSNLGLHPGLAKYLVKRDLRRPTQIQQVAVREAVKADMSLILAAETGSGKTLSFLLPMLNQMIKADRERKLNYIVVVPTRELAIQIFQVINDIFNVLNKIFQFSVVLVGGLSKEKQSRILLAHPGLVIGTPGRLFEMMQSDPYLADVSQLRRIVIDEADRMLEQGHFADLIKLVQFLNAKKQVQLTLCSATLNLPQLFKDKGMKFQKEKAADQGISILNAQNCSQAVHDVAQEYVNVLANLGFKSLSVKFIDKTPEHVINPSVLEKWNFVGSYQEKLEILLYLLLIFARPTIVFTNSINESKRLANACKLLGFNAVAIHAQMPQRQRLKNLDRLRDQKDTILFTTDICARGIDIPQVKLVIQFAGPNSAATHVHRIGRCVRVEGGQEQSGLAISLVERADEEVFKQILQACDYKRREAPKALKLDLELLEAVQIISKPLLSASEKELEHQSFARKTAVFQGYEKLFDTQLERNLLEAADLKRYHERVGRKFGKTSPEEQRARLQEIAQEIGADAQSSRAELITLLRRSIISVVKPASSSENLLLSTNPRAVAVPGDYQLADNLVRSRAANDIKQLARTQDKAARLIEPAAKVVLEGEDAGEKQQSPRGVDQWATKREQTAGNGAGKRINTTMRQESEKPAQKPGENKAGAAQSAQKSKKKQKRQEDEARGAQVITGKVLELHGEAELPMPEAGNKGKKNKNAKSQRGNSRKLAHEGREILGQLKSSGMHEDAARQ